MPFAAGTPQAKTCSVACRKRRSRRFKARPNDPEYDLAAGVSQEAMHEARDSAIKDLPDIARTVLMEEIRPHVREQLEGRALNTIGDMMDLLPLAHVALEETLRAVRQVYNEDGTAQYDEQGRAVVEADHAERRQAAALVYKYTVGQPGLAPQPEHPEQAPVTIVFPEGMAAHLGVVDTEAHEILELDAGENQCDTCGKVKAVEEFVAGSERCFACHVSNREKIEATIRERTGDG